MLKLTDRNTTGHFYNIYYYDEWIGYIRKRMDYRYSLLIFCAGGNDRIKQVLDLCSIDEIMPYVILAGYET